jgi:hypothetical protein
MANPFFSGRIPPALAIQIDAHLMVTGETRSELLVRLLRHEVSDNKPDNEADNIVDTKPDDMITNLLSRVERLEQLIDNKVDNIPDIKPDSIEIPEVSETVPETLPTTIEALAKRLKVGEKRLRDSAASDEAWNDLMESKPDPESIQWVRPIKVGKKWQIACLPPV